jgi:hypothetical protein
MEISRTKRKQLLWIIDFINKDIGSLGMGDFLKLLIEMGEILLDITPFFIGFIPKKGKKLYKEFFREDTPTTRETVKSIQKKIRTVFEKLYEAKNKKGAIWTEILGYEARISVLVNRGTIIITEKPKNNFEYKIAELISDCSPRAGTHRSLKNLKRCQAPIGRGGKQKCNNFFWQAYKKEKNYCSTRCVWRAYSFERRMAEKNPSLRSK